MSEVKHGEDKLTQKNKKKIKGMREPQPSRIYVQGDKNISDTIDGNKEPTDNKTTGTIENTKTATNSNNNESNTKDTTDDLGVTDKTNTLNTSSGTNNDKTATNVTKTVTNISNTNSDKTVTNGTNTNRTNTTETNTKGTNINYVPVIRNSNMRMGVTISKNKSINAKRIPKSKSVRTVKGKQVRKIKGKSNRRVKRVKKIKHTFVLNEFISKIESYDGIGDESIIQIVEMVPTVINDAIILAKHKPKSFLYFYYKLLETISKKVPVLVSYIDKLYDGLPPKSLDNMIRGTMKQVVDGLPSVLSMIFSKPDETISIVISSFLYTFIFLMTCMSGLMTAFVEKEMKMSMNAMSGRRRGYI